MQTIEKLDGARTKADDQMIAYVTALLRLSHELAWILMVSWAKLKLQDGSQWFAWRRSSCTVAQACLRGCKCILAVSVVFTQQVSSAPVHAGVYIPRVILTSPQIFATQPLKGVHMLSCRRSLSIRIGDEGMGFQLVYAENLSLGIGVLF